LAAIKGICVTPVGACAKGEAGGPDTDRGGRAHQPQNARLMRRGCEAH